LEDLVFEGGSDDEGGDDGDLAEHADEAHDEKEPRARQVQPAGGGKEQRGLDERAQKGPDQDANPRSLEPGVLASCEAYGDTVKLPENPAPDSLQKICQVPAGRGPNQASTPQTGS